MCCRTQAFLQSGTMTTTQARQSIFEFVIQDPEQRFSRDTQTKIRKQAMRAVGAARRRSDTRSDYSKSPSPKSVSKHRPRRDLDLACSLVPMPLSGLELLVRDRGIDPMDLSALTSIHIGQMSVGADPRLIKKCKLTSSSTEPRIYFHPNLLVSLVCSHVVKDRTFHLYRPSSDRL